MLNPLIEFVELHDQCMIIFLQALVHLIQRLILMMLLPLFTSPYLLTLLILLHDFIPLISESLNFYVQFLDIPIELVDKLILLGHLIASQSTCWHLLLLMLRVRSQGDW